MRTIPGYLLMLKFLFMLIGCGGTSTKTTSEAYGPFSIETITRKGKTWNMNYGRVPYTNVSYAIKYNGKGLEFNGVLEENTGVPGIWRVFVLKDAPQPTLLFGSQSLYIVTVENEAPKIIPIHAQTSDFASIQWLDSEDGQPGVYREVYSSDQFDTEKELTGGRYMAISHSLVLDTRTFEMMSFNPNNDLVDEYYMGNGMPAVAFSPDSAQLVYYGSKQDPEDYTKTYHALLVYNCRNGNHYAVPFDKDSLKLKDPFTFPEGWVNDYFEWQQQPDASYRLTPKALTTPLPRKGDILYARHQGYSYCVEPAEESLMHVLADHVLRELKLPKEKMLHQKEEFNNRITFFMPDSTNLVIQYGEYGEDLVLRQENIRHYSQENRELITRLGRGFDIYLQ